MLRMHNFVQHNGVVVSLIITNQCTDRMNANSSLKPMLFAFGDRVSGRREVHSRSMVVRYATPPFACSTEEMWLLNRILI